MAIEGVSLPFQEAIDFFQRKVDLPTRKWDDLRHQAHARAFSVAGVVQADMLADFRAAVDKAVTKGVSLQEFQKDFDNIVARTGWQFYARGKTDAERRAWRARLIYKTNLRTSYMAGRYAQMTDPDVLKYRPYWQYRHNDSRYPRPHHVAWNGQCLAADDPWWKTHFPPNGWGCNCDVVALSKRQLTALGKSGPDKAPYERPIETVDPRTGQPETRYPGIDRGWEYNVGEASLKGVVPVELQAPLSPLTPPPAPAKLPLLRPAQAVPASRVLPAGRPDQEYVESFLKEFGADLATPVEWRDPSGGIIGIDKSLFEQRGPNGAVYGFKSMKRDRGLYTLLLADAIKDPDEIWAEWVAVASGVALRRSYLKRVLLPNGKTLFVRFEWSPRGWFGITGFDTTETYVEQFRRGALLYASK
ncbi:hypothetical protein D3874_03075 [Oleomonas cavernae]|uniref:Phage head morphogenesis domain-containing protein n=1 Tax=Oleomonas cavernae TaxID=2320859 RepID=A0A418WU69_9PROT|nr:PBECR2 nuclease fold domain-containing protein [Oleomonas cavernae]RJF94813.1 hypothetical protein D3874_03075 [Oleomonas cavernae]